MYTESTGTLDPTGATGGAACEDLSGDWNGKWTCDPRFYGPDASELDGAFAVRLQFTPGSDDAAATFSGPGTDHIGAFLITGHLDMTRKRVSFKKEYTMVQSGYHKPAWRYRGDLDIDLLSVSGDWGGWEEDETDFMECGAFYMERAPITTSES